MELVFLSICYFHIHFHLITTIVVDEMYEKCMKKWCLKLQYLTTVQLVIMSPFVPHVNSYIIETSLKNCKQQKLVIIWKNKIFQENSY